MDYFNDLFHKAVSIKHEEMLSKRDKFEKQPLFIKIGLYYSTKYENTRKQQFNVRFYACELLKVQGNVFYKQNDFENSARIYEQALSIYR